MSTTSHYKDSHKILLTISVFVGCKDQNSGDHVYFAETDSNLNLLNFNEIPLGLTRTAYGITHDYNTKEVYITETHTGIHKLNLDTMGHELVIDIPDGKYYVICDQLS